MTSKLHRLLARPAMLYFFVFGILLCETTGMSFLKEYSMNGDVLTLVAGLSFYFLVCLLLVQSMHYDGIGIVNVLWSASSVLFVLIVGVILFGEHVSFFQMVGIMCVVLGVILIRLNEDRKKKCPHCSPLPQH